LEEVGEDMAKFGKYYHSSTITSNVASIGTSFDKTKVHTHQLLDSDLIAEQRFRGFVEGFYIRVTNITGGSATPTVTLRVSCDADGDYSFFPDTDGELALGLTTTNSGVAVYQFQLPLQQFFNSDELYVFIKIDQGTCTLANSCIVWSE
jgi:hypothetical protein